MARRTQLPPGDGIPYLEITEAALNAEIPDVRYLDQAMPRLGKMIGQYQARIDQLQRLQARAKAIIDQHEPATAKQSKKN